MHVYNSEGTHLATSDEPAVLAFAVSVIGGEGARIEKPGRRGVLYIEGEYDVEPMASYDDFADYLDAVMDIHDENTHYRKARAHAAWRVYGEHLTSELKERCVSLGVIAS